MNGHHRQASLEHSVHGQESSSPVDTGSLKWEVGMSVDNYHIMYREWGFEESPEKNHLFILYEKV